MYQLVQKACFYVLSKLGGAGCIRHYCPSTSSWVGRSTESLVSMFSRMSCIWFSFLVDVDNLEDAVGGFEFWKWWNDFSEVSKFWNDFSEFSEWIIFYFDEFSCIATCLFRYFSQICKFRFIWAWKMLYFLDLNLQLVACSNMVLISLLRSLYAMKCNCIQRHLWFNVLCFNSLECVLHRPNKSVGRWISFG